jgi:hypothetical protein
MAPKRMHGEDGVSLMLALAFIVLFAVTIPPLLNLGTGNLLATSRLSEQRAAVYAADGATDAAIQYLRLYPGCGRPFQVSGTASGQCPIYTGPSTSTFQTDVNGKAASVLITAAGSPGTLERTVTLATTVTGATTSINATVVLHDPGSGSPPPPAASAPVDVQNWTLTR